MNSMKYLIKSLLHRYPTVFNPLWSLVYPWIIRRDEKYFGNEYTDRLSAFQIIYEENRWGSLESLQRTRQHSRLHQRSQKVVGTIPNCA